MICIHENATLLPGLLCPRIGPPLLAICTVAIGAGPKYYGVLARRRIVWIPAFSFSKAGDVGPNNRSSLTDLRRYDVK
jgi:hypothetical protein